MKIILFVAFLFSLLHAVYAQENSGTCSKKNKYDSQQLKSATLTVAQIAETEKYDVHFYGLNLNMTNTSTYLTGTGRIDAKAKSQLLGASRWYSRRVCPLHVEREPQMG